MFTGLIEEIGIIKSKVSVPSGLRFTVEAKTILDDLQTGDSVSIDGACQTVTEIKDNLFCFDTVHETIIKTTLGTFEVGQRVNLERAMLPTSRFGGHFVLGHVDTRGVLHRIDNDGANKILHIEVPMEFTKYLVRVGSIAADGISFTIASLERNIFTISVIPHTWEHTTLKWKQGGDKVNIEFDLLGKYVLNSLEQGENKKGISEEWLRDSGF